ncbi:MAG: hypothetical protein JWN44_5630 [Myxococcales bacterium]|nr:hypothetical protein [Myxococcales bacterium]
MTPPRDRFLSASVHELIDFFENAAIGLQSIGPDGEVLWANQALVNLLGYDREQYVGHHIAEFHAEPAVVRSFMERLTAGETLRDFEAPLRHRDGSLRHVLIDANVYREEGQFVHTRCFVRDVTERKRLEDELARHARELALADRCKDEFLANLSHELRTPLNAVLGWARLLRGGKLTDDRREHAIHTIERNAAAQAKLIEDLLDVSRIISGKLTLDARPIPLSRVVADVVEAETPVAEAKGVHISFAPDDAAPIVIGDMNRLQQIVGNLVVNAIKFTPAHGHVRVAVEHDSSTVRVDVRDDGRGIAPAFIPFVFERFRQADGTSTRGHSGLGLGLTIVRDLVALHGGTVSVSSGGEGKGASFTVSLPLAALQFREVRLDDELAAAFSHATSDELRGLSILIVDDQPDACDLMSTVLQGSGACVAAVGTVAAALAAVESRLPDLVISDIGLPDEDGYDLIRKLRALPTERGGDTPVIALTAYAHPDDRRRALRAGFDQHVGKPIEPDALIALVGRAALKARRGRQQSGVVAAGSL